MLSENYVRFVLAIAPLVVCLAWFTETKFRRRHLWPTLICALFFAASWSFAPLAGWGVLPWLAACLVRGWLVAASAARERDFALHRISSVAAHLYLPVGGIWALLSQLGLQPLGYSAVIVLLTGVHFHYAGFALPWLTGRLLSLRPAGVFQRASAVGVVAGVPLVAIGIVSSQIGLPHWVETAAVTILAGSAFGVSQGYLAWSGEPGKGVVRLCFFTGGLALAGGMVLAMLYGWRYWFPISWVTIPAMYALHGTLNSWGFCLPAILGNTLLARSGAEGEQAVGE